MKRITTLFTVITLLLLLGVAGCEKEKINIEDFSYLKCVPVPVMGTKGDVVGTWKLIQTWSIIGSNGPAAVLDTIDVSCKDVYYEFKKDNTLKVIGNVGNVPSGTYEYSYLEFNACPLCLPSPNLSINELDTAYFCMVEPYKMLINQNMFVRIK